MIVLHENVDSTIQVAKIVQDKAQVRTDTGAAETVLHTGYTNCSIFPDVDRGVLGSDISQRVS